MAEGEGRKKISLADFDHPLLFIIAIFLVVQALRKGLPPLAARVGWNGVASALS